MTISDLLKELVKLDGSDLFLIVGSPPVVSVKGKLIPVGNGKLTPEMTKRLAVSLMNEKQKISFVRNKELNISHSIHGFGRFRVNIFNQRGTIGLVIRRIKLKIQSIDDLKLPPILKDLAMEKRGLILVTGATGSGKSTTLAAMIDYRNSNSDGHIVTIEDPLEFVHPHKKSVVTQREVGMDTLSYANALKSALRQAPDVILIGEIRDRETMEAAISFAETGHLVLSTLHSNNANQTLERILNFFPADMHSMIHLQLSLNLKGVICQRLVPSVDGKGRVAVLEVMISTPRIADLIHKGDTTGLKSVIAAGTHEGMQTFDQHLYKLYKEGRISYDTAIKAADSANDLKLRIKMESPEEIKTEGISLEAETEESILK
ncbi:type IV pili twitching motility protein PilT [candidate division KSB1 bacterium]|nr:MAG: type IV pili twitching motility protein PilT [candidate division KSB1 bacterium]